MKIKAYDRCNKQHLIISFLDDEIDLDSLSSNSASGRVYVNFEIDPTENYNREDPNPKRFSDLESLTIK